MGCVRSCPRIDILATSPLVRAVQTAEILGDSYKRKLVSVESLRPEARYEDFAIWARAHGGKNTVAIVGHEPHLSGLASWLLASSKRSLMELKKGAACLLEFEDSPGAAAATLLWSMAPKHLRAVGRR